MSFENTIKTWQKALKAYDTIAKKCYRKINRKLDDKTLTNDDLVEAIERIGKLLIIVSTSDIAISGSFLDNAEEKLFSTISKLDSKLATIDRMETDNSEENSDDNSDADSTELSSDDNETDDYAIFSDEKED